MTKEKAVVVLSGGQDSATCLLWALRARENGALRAGDYEVKALSFDYGQRHRVELDAAKKLSAVLGVEHEVLELGALNKAAPSALTREQIDVKADGGLGGLPSTFTPGRNLVFLTVAASYAIARGARTLITGVCQTDYSGYPDCRRDTIDALERAINLGNGIEDFSIKTPLMYLTKAETVELAASLEGLDLMGLTHTCYLGKQPACGKCPACLLRLKGFAEAGFTDPLQYEAA
jgi:7-cyano-7-deazaguanine synthase